jgi:preprotein translocase subunit SecE
MAASKFRNSFVWVLIVFLLSCSVWANYYFTAIDTSLKLIGWIVVAIIGLALFLFTEQGAKAKAFASASKLELLKVVWPTKDETVKTTLLVIVLVLVLALVIWGLDSVLFNVIGLLTGQNG